MAAQTNISVEEARKHLQRADIRWRAALERFDSYEDRLRRLAAAAEQERNALFLVEISRAPWVPIEVGENYTLADYLEPGRRPGSDQIWTEFDAAVTQLGRSMGGDSRPALAAAFGELAAAANQLADRLGEIETRQKSRQRMAS